LSGTTSLHISLPEILKEFVLKRVEEGAYSNPSDYVRALIRADRAKREELDHLLLEGLSSKAEPVTPGYRAELRREVEAIVAKATPKRA
jgi:antitoxin ParD1/3/4